MWGFQGEGEGSRPAPARLPLFSGGELCERAVRPSATRPQRRSALARIEQTRAAPSVALRKRGPSGRESRSNRAAPRPRTLGLGGSDDEVDAARARQRHRGAYARRRRWRLAARFPFVSARRAVVAARDRADKPSSCRSRTIEAPAAQGVGRLSRTSALVGSTRSTSVAAHFRASSNASASSTIRCSSPMPGSTRSPPRALAATLPVLRRYRKEAAVRTGHRGAVGAGLVRANITVDQPTRGLGDQELDPGAGLGWAWSGRPRRQLARERQAAETE